MAECKSRDYVVTISSVSKAANREVVQEQWEGMHSLD
jgi:hypothetical protein